MAVSSKPMDVAMFEGTDQERVEDDGLRAVCGILIGAAIGLGVWLVIIIAGVCWLF